MHLRTGPIFWIDRDGPVPHYPPLTEAADADVVVIGAGVTGALVAHELSEAGAHVLVLDSRDVVSGSSAASSGLLLYETDSSLQDLVDRIGEKSAVRVYGLGLAAIDRIEQLCQLVGDACGFLRRPNLYLASDDAAVPTLRREFELRRRHGFDVVYYDSAAIASTYDFNAPAAIYSQGTAEIDTYRFTRRLLERAASLGAGIHSKSPVTKLEPRGRDIVVEIAGGRRVHARHVVCASGYEAATHLRRTTGRLASTWVMVTDPVDEFVGWPDRCLIWETRRPYFYLRTTEDGRVMAGGEDEPDPEAHRDPRRLESKQLQLAARTREKFPRLRIQPAFVWAATFATTDDGLPFIGESDECPGVLFALGYGGNGITFSVMAAAIVRDLCEGRSNTDAELFRFDRQLT